MAVKNQIVEIYDLLKLNSLHSYLLESQRKKALKKYNTFLNFTYFCTLQKALSSRVSLFYTKSFRRLSSSSISTKYSNISS